VSTASQQRELYTILPLLRWVDAFALDEPLPWH
jgi:hypothetical protein